MNQYKYACKIQQYSVVHRQLQCKILPLMQRHKNIRNIIKTESRREFHAFTSAEVRRTTGQPHISPIVQVRRRRFSVFDQIARIPDETDAKKILILIPATGEYNLCNTFFLYLYLKFLFVFSFLCFSDNCFNDLHGSSTTLLLSDLFSNRVEEHELQRRRL